MANLELAHLHVFNRAPCTTDSMFAAALTNPSTKINLPSRHTLSKRHNTT